MDQAERVIVRSLLILLAGGSGLILVSALLGRTGAAPDLGMPALCLAMALTGLAASWSGTRSGGGPPG